MNGMSDEEFERIYGRPPIRKKVKKKKIYWNRIIIAIIILILIIFGLVKLVSAIVSAVKDDSSSSEAKPVSNSTAVSDSVEDESSQAAKEYENVSLVVCVDAGHGDYDGGTTSLDGTRYEKDDDLALALVVQKYLEKYGVTVVMTREEDVFLELQDRCDMANNANADMFICLHRNSYDGEISGVEAWVHNKEPEPDTLLANNILKNLEEVGVTENRGVRYGYVGNSYINYFVNAETVMPSCLVELGFLTDDRDNQLFDENLEEYGKAIADAAVETAQQLGVIDEKGNRLVSGQLISQDKPINNKDDSSSEISMERTEPSTTGDSIYNTQENEYAQ